MKTKLIALILAGHLLLSGCASTTIIQTTPSNANLYINGEPVGKTPYAYRDTKIVGSTNYLKIEKEGYEPFETYFSRDEEVDPGAIVGGVFLWVPFLWIMKYKPTHTYELIPASANTQSAPNSLVPNQAVTEANQKSKAERLREFKKLLDDKVITQEEYEKEKKKILDEN